MDGPGTTVQQLRARLLERDLDVHRLQSAKLDLEDSLSDAARRTGTAEATNRRLAEELSALKWTMQDLVATSSAQQTGGDASTAAGKEVGFATGGDGGHHSRPHGRQRAGDVVHASVNAQLSVDLQDMQWAALLWKVTAQLVLQSYRGHMAVVRDEQRAFDSLSSLHVAAVLQWLRASEQRRLSAERSLDAVSKLSNVDESRRLEQFRELAAVREQLVLLEGAKVLADRRTIAQDDQLHAAEGQLRALSSDAHALAYERNVLLARIDTLSAVVLDHASVKDHELRTSLMSHSQLRTELSRAQQALAICQAEKAELKERLRHVLRATTPPPFAAAAAAAAGGPSQPGAAGGSPASRHGPRAAGTYFSQNSTPSSALAGTPAGASPRAGGAALAGDRSGLEHQQGPLLAAYDGAAGQHSFVAASYAGAGASPQPAPRMGLSLRRVRDVASATRQMYVDATADLFPAPTTVLSPPGSARGGRAPAGRSPRSASRPFR